MHLITPDVHHALLTARSASGSVIYTDDGKRILDGCSGAIACSLGYGHGHVIDKMLEHACLLSAAYRTQFLNDPAQQLAERLCCKLGYAGAFFVNSGSEAVETACRMAVQYWNEKGLSPKKHILSRNISYHGSTKATLSLSGHWPRRRGVCSPAERPTLPTPYCYRCPYGKTPDTCQLACAHALTTQLGEIGSEHVAAVLIEPITGASGAAIVPPAGYLETIRAICDRHNILLIADEVLTAMGRTGKWLAIEHGNVQADISILGKGLNAGYFPISGVLVCGSIKEAIESGSGIFPHGHTHSNHPIGAAAANAVLDVIETEDLVSLTAERELLIESHLRNLLQTSPLIGDIRGKGMFWGMEIVREKAAKRTFASDSAVSGKLVRHALSKGLNLYPSAGFAAFEHGDALIFAAPLNTCTDILDEMLSLLREVIYSAPDFLRKESIHA